MIKIFNNYIKIDTLKTTLLLKNNQKDIEKIYYGSSILDQQDFDFLSQYQKDDYRGSMDDENNYLKVFSTPGDGNDLESMVLVRDHQYRFIYRFNVDSVKLIDNYQIEGFPQGRLKEKTVEIKFISTEGKIEVNLLISTYKNSDVISFSTNLTNHDSNEIIVERLLSLQMDFHKQNTTLYTFDGRWLQERHLNKTTIKQGTFKVDSKTGHSSNHHNPLTILHNDLEGFFGANLIYSGNHQTIINKSMFQSTRYLVGLNDYMTSFVLKHKEIIKSPEAIMTYGKTVSEVSTNFHKFINSHIIPQKFQKNIRPILINNWEGTYFDFNYEKIMHIANKASDLGIELFVLDDGWFGKRDSDTSSLGDWIDYKSKTGGLKKLSTDIKNTGMKFGLWFEPEMISPDSDLYRQKSHYAMQINNLEPMLKRTQLMLDMTNDEVIDYLYDKISNLIVELQLDYIKWDCNRYFTDINANNQEYQRAYYYHYYVNLYKLMDKITTNFPNVLFESCSAGGNRFDLGMLYYMAQTWTSDNTDAKDRLFIQEGTLYGYPQSSLCSHVSIVPNHQTKNSTSLENRFNIASVGSFGYQLDITKLSNSDLETVKKQVEFYKEYRELLQFGNYHLIESVFENKSTNWIVVNEDQTQAIATIVHLEKETSWKRPRFKFGYLNDKYTYEVKIRNQSNLDKDFKPLIITGSMLNNYGIDLGDLFETNDRFEFSNSIESRMVIINKI